MANFKVRWISGHRESPCLVFYTGPDSLWKYAITHLNTEDKCPNLGLQDHDRTFKECFSILFESWSTASLYKKFVSDVVSYIYPHLPTPLRK